MSLLDQLNEAGESAPGWRPENPGDFVLGTLTDIGQASDFNGDPYRIYTIRLTQPAGEYAAGDRVAVHAFHGVLKQELSKFKLVLGCELGVKFMGKPEGKRYNRYAVVSTAEFNLDPVSVEDDVKSDLDSGGFQPVDFRPQSTVASPNAADDPVPF